MAKLYFSYAAMNAGKSTILLQASYNYRERGMRTLLFTSALYAETASASIVSRLGIAEKAELYGDDDDLFAWIKQNTRRSEVALRLRRRSAVPDHRRRSGSSPASPTGCSIPVMCFGLRTDFQGKLFPGSSELLAIADVLREIRTICYCGAKATMVVRQGADGQALTEGDQVSIEKSVYVSLCRRHWEEATGRWPPTGSSAMSCSREHRPHRPNRAAPSPSAPSPCPPTPIPPATSSAAG